MRARGRVSVVLVLPLALSVSSCTPEDTAPVEPGVAWTQRWTGDGTLSAIAWSGSQFVVMGPGGVVTSPDGLKWNLTDWTDVPLAGLVGPRPTSFGVQSVTWGGSQFVAVGYTRQDPRTFDARAIILTSPDGVSWTTRRPADPVSWNVTDVVWSGQRYVAVAVSSHPTFLTSADGVAWTTQDAAAAGYVTAITWGGGQFVAVGAYAPPSSPLILTSPDGARWTERTSRDSGDALSDVAWSGDQFVAVGFSTILTSRDAVTWSARAVPVPGPGFQAIAWGGSQFVVLGGGILTSPDGITWTRRSLRGEFLHGSTGVAWSGTRFVVLGSRRRGWFADYLNALILSSP